MIRKHGGLAVAVGVFVAAQLRHTIKDSNRWPLCSYNMFNRTLPARVSLLKVRLLDGSGTEPLQDTWGVLPLEFFRTQALLYEVMTQADDGTRARFSRALVDQLNDRPWRGFDEVRRSCRPCPGRRFTGFDLLLAEIDPRSYDGGRGGPLLSLEPVYSWRDDRTRTRTGPDREDGRISP